jgi:septum site-determining protein MinC
MSKLAIISRPDQGVLIDMSACQSMAEAVEQLSSSLQVSTKFLQGQVVDINLGALRLNQTELTQILALIARMGVQPREVLAFDPQTRALIDARRYANIVNPQIELERAPEALAAPASTFPPVPPVQEAPLSQETTLPTPPTVQTTSVHQLPTLNVTFAPAQDGSANEGDSTGTVTVDTTADRIVMVEDSEPTEADEPSPAVQERADGTAAKDEKTAPGTLHVRQNLRSGQAVSTPGNLVLIGDVNAGGEVIAGGDITVWGALRGIAHAGVGGNNDAEIRALKLDPIQIRIGNAIARSPDQAHIRPGVMPGPETARLVDGQIRITRSYFE